MMLREQDRHFLWSLYAAVSIIFIWKGLWDGIYEIPYLGNAWTALFVGLAMLTFSGMIFNEFDPLGSVTKSVLNKIHLVEAHKDRKNFKIMYFDKNLKKQVSIPAMRLRRVEKSTLVVRHENNRQESFIPLHRVTGLIYKGQAYWRV